MLVSAARKMRARRRRREEFLAFDTTEIRILCDDATHEIRGMERRTQRTSEELVEECMLAANSAVAEEISVSPIAGLYRIHPEPEAEKLERENFSLYNFVVEHGATRTRLCEEIEGLELVFDERVLLPYRAQADAAAQLVHREQVLFPVGVKDFEEYVAVYLRRKLWAELLRLLAEARADVLDDARAHFFKGVLGIYAFEA